jgi:hypothetical protein
VLQRRFGLPDATFPPRPPDVVACKALRCVGLAGVLVVSSRRFGGVNKRVTDRCGFSFFFFEIVPPHTYLRTYLRNQSLDLDVDICIDSQN